MEHLGYICDYQEVEDVDELKQKLMYTNIELEAVKLFKLDLLNLLKIAYQERDEARKQLHKLQNNLVSSTTTQLPKSFSEAQFESLLVLPTKVNSSITESNSLSHGSSPVDSFIDAVSSPDFLSINVVDSYNVAYVNQPLVQDNNCSASPALVSAQKPKCDPATIVIDALVKGKALPQKGKLLQAVMEAGPLLQTLLVAGPLPSWRNPPPLQPIKVPPFTIKDSEIPISSSIPAAISCYTPQTCSASIVNFACSPSGPSSNAWQSASNASVNNQVYSSKRQRLQ